MALHHSLNNFCSRHRPCSKSYPRIPSNILSLASLADTLSVTGRQKPLKYLPYCLFHLIVRVIELRDPPPPSCYRQSSAAFIHLIDCQFSCETKLHKEVRGGRAQNFADDDNFPGYEFSSTVVIGGRCASPGSFQALQLHFMGKL